MPSAFFRLCLGARQGQTEKPQTIEALKEVIGLGEK